MRTAVIHFKFIFILECWKCLFQTFFFKGRRNDWVLEEQTAHLPHGESVEQKWLTYPMVTQWNRNSSFTHGESMKQKLLIYPMVSQWNRNNSLTPWWVNRTEMTRLPHGDSMEQKWLTYLMECKWNRNDSLTPMVSQCNRNNSLIPWWVNGTEMTHLPHGETMEQKWLTPWWDNGIKNDLPSVSQWNKK